MSQNHFVAVAILYRSNRISSSLSVFTKSELMHFSIFVAYFAGGKQAFKVKIQSGVRRDCAMLLNLKSSHSSHITIFAFAIAL